MVTMANPSSSFAARAARISASPTMKVAAEAMALKAKGIDVVDLGAGEPDFPTPTHISAAAHAAIDANFTKYTTNSGTDELKRAIVARYSADCGIEYATNEVIISAGGKQALFNAVMVLFGAGDEVITHMPGWPTLVEQIKLADATPVIVHTHAEDGFRLRAETFLGALTPKTRGIIINSPGNPTGALMSEEDLETVAKEAGKRGIWVLLDLCYEKLIYDPTPHNLPGVLVRTMRDDRLALWLDAGTGRGRRRVQRPAEPFDIERLLDHPEGGGRRAERFADVRHRYARRVSQAPRSAVHVARRGAAAAARQTGGRVLSLPGCLRLPVAGRCPHVRRARAVPARRSARGAHAGRGLRCAGIRTYLVRRVDGGPRTGREEDHRPLALGRARAAGNDRVAPLAGK
jgi:hypothetical protein